MSAPRHHLVLTQTAWNDIRSILLFTRQQWGSEQRDRYHAMLNQALADIERFPEIGVERPDYFDGCRIQPVQQHIVYDQVTSHALSVIRVLHKRIDADSLFTERNALL